MVASPFEVLMASFEEAEATEAKIMGISFLHMSNRAISPAKMHIHQSDMNVTPAKMHVHQSDMNVTLSSKWAKGSKPQSNASSLKGITPFSGSDASPNKTDSNEIALIEQSIHINFGSIWSIVVTIIVIILVILLIFVCYQHYYNKKSFEDIGHYIDDYENKASRTVRRGTQRSSRAMRSDDDQCC